MTLTALLMFLQGSVKLGNPVSTLFSLTSLRLPKTRVSFIRVQVITISYIRFWKPDTCDQRQKPQQNNPLKLLIRIHFKLNYQQCLSLSHTFDDPDDVYYWCWHQLYDQVLDAHAPKITVKKCPSPAGVFITDVIIHMKKLLDSDWLRAVQFKCNTSAKSVTPVQKV